MRSQPFCFYRKQRAKLEHVDLQDADQVVTHQATGMVSVQLGVTLAQAQVVLRAAAYAEGSRLSEVAREVVARQRRFDPERTP